METWGRLPKSRIMKKTCYIFIAMMCISLSALQAADPVYCTFDPTVRYSRVVIDAHLYDFKANKTAAGFSKYDESGTLVKQRDSDNKGFDYVPGLVAKAVLEAVDLYQDSAWAKPWFYSVQAYGDAYVAEKKGGGSLDNLNAYKMYFGLYNLTKIGAKFADATKSAAYKTAKGNALAGLEAHNESYSITSPTSQAFSGTEDFTGGWWHKSSYANEMWCDGQYMGPALLAQLLADGYTFNNMSSTDAWNLVAKQFTMTWKKLWDSDKKLLWHAFSATPSQDTNWADQDKTSTHYGVSQEYWGRAAGWYFLALVDVLELMPTSCTYRDTLHSYLNKVAEGLAVRQQTASGEWCQLLAYNVGDTPSDSTENYLEASASAIFTAAYLKGMRLGLFDTDYTELAKKAYQGLINNFLSTDYYLVPTCASAGLSDKRDGSAAYYLAEVGEKDTKKITSSMEGKPFGAFILAAVEYERKYMLPTTVNDQTTPTPNPDSGSTSQTTCHCLTVTFK